MTRIIAGHAGSLPLDVPDAGTRPTSDRVRESAFQVLDAAGAIGGARVLDLYAGSGALALEALSRGAQEADLVEKAPRAASVAASNAARVAKALGARPARVHRMPAEAFLASIPGPYDLVFLDPPYALTDADLLAALELLIPTLSPDATVVIERSARSPEPPLPDALETTRHKRYGDTAIWWVELTRTPPQPPRESQSR